MPTNANNGTLMLMAYVKAAVVLVFAFVVAYLLVVGKGDTDKLVALVCLVLGAQFGVSSYLYAKTAAQREAELRKEIKTLVKAEVLEGMSSNDALMEVLQGMMEEQIRRYSTRT